MMRVVWQQNWVTFASLAALLAFELVFRVVLAGNANTAHEILGGVLIPGGLWLILRQCFDGTTYTEKLTLPDNSTITYGQAGSYFALGLALLIFPALVVEGGWERDIAMTGIEKLAMAVYAAASLKFLWSGGWWLLTLRQRQAAHDAEQATRHRAEMALHAQAPHGAAQFATADDLRRGGFIE